MDDETVIESLTAVARELYGRAPGEFVAARTAAATEAADRVDKVLATRIKRLAKPSVAAWAVNLFVRERPGELDELLALGRRLREASSGDELRELGRERQRMLGEAGRAAHELGVAAGTAVSEAAAIEVQQTLQAALVDAEAEAAVRSGMLVRTLRTDGISPVEVAGALPAGLGDEPPAPHPAERSGTRAGAASSAGHANPPAEHRGEPGHAGSTGEAEGVADPTVDPHDDSISSAAEPSARERRLAEAKRDADETRQEAEDAEAELATLESAIAENRERRDRLSFELRELKARLDDLHDELETENLAASTLRRDHQSAQRAADTARRLATRSAARLDRLR